MGVSNGFELEGSTEQVRKWLMDWCNDHNFLQTLRIVAWDMMAYGSNFTEICKEDEPDPDKWWIKCLDPVHMRVRRDQFGNVFGYIQLLTYPPVPFLPEEVIHFKNEPKSNWYEYNYGTSDLRPLLLIQEYIDRFQRDMAVITSIYTKPMIVVKGGTPDKPFNEEQIASLMNYIANRGPSTDIFVRGDVTVETMQSMTRTINVDWWINYLERQRKAILGVPDIFLGEPSGTNKATAEIVMQEYITRLRMLQEIIGDDIETMLFSQLVKAKFGKGTEVPSMKWRPIAEPTLTEKAQVYAQGLQLGAITQVEYRAVLGLPDQPVTKVQSGTQALSQLPKVNESMQRLGNVAFFTKDGQNFLVAEIIPASNR